MSKGILRCVRRKPGQYEIRRIDGDSFMLVGIVERSSMMPWCWWWSSWDERTDKTGATGAFVKSREQALNALRGTV